MPKSRWDQYKHLLLFIAAATIVVCCILLLFFRTGAYTGLVSKTLYMLEPFIYGGVIAYLLKPMVFRIERFLTRIAGEKHHGALRMIAILLSLLTMAAVLLLLLMSVLPEMISSIARIVRQLPVVLREFQSWLAGLDHGDTSHEVVTYIQETVSTITERLQSFLQTDVLPNLQKMVSNVTSSFMNIFNVVKNFGLGCIISAYLLGGWEKYLHQAKLILYSLFPKRIADWIKKEVLFTDQMFSGFIRGKLLDSLMIGLICFVFTQIARMPYAVLISVVVGVTNIIPFFGPYLGAIPSALLILTVSPAKCVVFLVFVIILQQIDGNLLGPMILGDRLGISGIWILFSILLFSSLFGIVGMLIGVPVFAVLYDLIRSAVTAALRRRGEADMLDDYEQTYHPKEEAPAKNKA